MVVAFSASKLRPLETTSKESILRFIDVALLAVTFAFPDIIPFKLTLRLAASAALMLPSCVSYWLSLT